MRSHIVIDSKSYKLARSNQVPTGGRRWQVTQRPSEPGDPSDLYVAEWEFGSHFWSVEGPDRYLGVDWAQGCDTRWAIGLTLGPLINSTYLALGNLNAPGSAVVHHTSNGDWLYVGARGVPGGASDLEVWKIDLSDMTLDQTKAHAADITGPLILTRSANGTVEISAPLTGVAYQVMTAEGTTDTWSANNESKEQTILGIAHDRIIGMKNGVLEGNVLSGSVTMDASNWQSIDTIIGDPFTPTGFALDGSLWVINTDNGPYLLDSNELSYYPLMEEVSRDALNRVTETWYPVGVLLGWNFGLRYLRAGYGQSIGPEAYATNRSPVMGAVTGFGGTERNTAYYAVLTDWTPTGGSGGEFVTMGGSDPANTTTIVAVRPEGDPRHPLGWAPYVITGLFDASGLGVGGSATQKIDSIGFLKYIGTADGARTNPTLVGGLKFTVGISLHAALFWITLGGTPQEYLDNNYRFAPAGDVFLTEMRRHHGLLHDLEWVEFESEDCDAQHTVTFSVQPNGSTDTSRSLTGTLTYTGGATLNGVVDTDGKQRLLFVDNSSVPHTWAQGCRRPKPSLAMVTDDSTETPKLVGNLRMGYRLRPEMTKVIDFAVVLETDPYRTAEQQEEDLLDEWGSGAIAITDVDDDAYYVRVTNVRVTEVAEKGGKEDSPSPIRVAQVQAIRWTTT